ncbi:hypothetical protein [Mycoplana rhizolycopersici]|uniref:Ribbon-helix-helix protein CopG domain-containing protein n=1 Tax=Mycoplana rhizolycopersici TaxID=2746702 RepID=A0ABX2QDZ8_9HYPH|nr:hypothetical protein [Rhizobium rhizolycopersici]NVP55989.1 hypothetical protein [Rhizobium rhizolycopersici]
MVKPRENRVPIMMSDAELKAIDDWRFANRVATRSEAVRRLCQIGLQVEEPLLKLFDSARAHLAETETPEFLSMWNDEALKAAWTDKTAFNSVQMAVRALQIAEIMISLQQGASVEEAVSTAALEKERFEHWFRSAPKENEE